MQTITKYNSKLHTMMDKLEESFYHLSRKFL